eukprot:m.189258 g.189258  ORF g.189258 m.189258 type:complete len:175 (+) comp17693_c0_seq1:74-598(+)
MGATRRSRRQKAAATAKSASAPAATTTPATDTASSVKATQDQSSAMDEGAAERASDDAGDVENTALRRTPASGRWWKPMPSGRSSAKAVKSKPKKGSSWARRKEKEKAYKDVTQFEKELKERNAREKQEGRERSEARKKMREENERRGEVVVPITNTRKLKKMSRKQLRLLDKR